jgi:thiosulfate reductase/polysulfide reductase chain A
MSEIIDFKRRRILQGSAAAVAIGATGVSTTLFAENSVDEKTRKQNEIKNAKYVPTLCEMCVNACAVIAKVVDGKVIKLDPNPLFPKSRSFDCARGNAGIATTYDPDRLKWPMKLVGEKGDGVYERISWEQAYKEISEKLLKIVDEEKDNRSTIAFGMGAGLGEPTFHHFAEAFGSTNQVDHYTTCFAPAFIANKLTYGSWGNSDFENSEYVIMMGANRAEAIVTPDTLDLFKRTHGRGSKIVYIDVRYTNTAAQSDEFFAIKPGTDLALIMAMIYHSIDKGLYNKEYVAKNTEGFDVLAKEVKKNAYTPEWASKITEIPADDIIRITEEFAKVARETNGAANMYRSRKSTWYYQDFQLRRAQAIFNAIHGCINTKGGVLLGKGISLDSPKHHYPLYDNAKNRIDMEFYSKDMPLMNAAKGSWQVFRDKVTEVNTKVKNGEALSDGEYPVRGMFIYKENPVQSVPDMQKSIDMFKSMDLVVVTDVVPSDTAMYADYILPEATYLERVDPVKSFGTLSEPSLAQRNAAIKPMYESKPIRDILFDLTKKIEHELYEITLKHTKGKLKEYVIKDKKLFHISHTFAHTVEEVNSHKVHKHHGADDILKKYGVWYPGIEEKIKHIDPHTLTWKAEYKDKNNVDYYPEDKKIHTVKMSKIQLHLPFLDEATAKNPITGKKEVVGGIPVWKDSWYQEVPEGKYRLVVGRHGYFTQNSHSNNYMLLDLMNYNYVWLNDEIAKNMNLEFKDDIILKSKVGEIKAKVYPTKKIRKDSIFFSTGLGAKSPMMTLGGGNGLSQAEILEDSYDPIIGAASMHETFVEIKKV